MYYNIYVERSIETVIEIRLEEKVEQGFSIGEDVSTKEYLTCFEACWLSQLEGWKD